jgi:hypothetical protein
MISQEGRNIWESRKDPLLGHYYFLHVNNITKIINMYFLLYPDYTKLYYKEDLCVWSLNNRLL